MCALVIKTDPALRLLAVALLLPVVTACSMLRVPRDQQSVTSPHLEAFNDARRIGARAQEAVQTSGAVVRKAQD